MSAFEKSGDEGTTKVPELTSTGEKTDTSAKDAGADVANGDGADGEGDGDPEEEAKVEFDPIVKLEKVETVSGEEEETVLHEERCKVYVHAEAMLDKGTGNAQWLQKGVGQAKILKHKENSRIRLLMRQEKTLKICINHFLDHQITLQPNQGNAETSWVWKAWDFSDGKELVETTFAIRFKKPEEAKLFGEKFKEAQDENKELMAGADKKEGAEDADELAAAVENVKVTDKEEGEEAA
jgi:Ran-binding protein 1